MRNCKTPLNILYLGSIKLTHTAPSRSSSKQQCRGFEPKSTESKKKKTKVKSTLNLSNKIYATVQSIIVCSEIDSQLPRTEIFLSFSPIVLSYYIVLPIERPSFDCLYFLFFEVVYVRSVLGAIRPWWNRTHANPDRSSAQPKSTKHLVWVSL